MRNDDLEATKKKLAELDYKYVLLTNKTFAYLSAILQVLQNKRIVDSKEMIQYLDFYKRKFSEASRDIEFFEKKKR